MDPLFDMIYGSFLQEADEPSFVFDKNKTGIVIDKNDKLIVRIWTRIRIIIHSIINKISDFMVKLKTRKFEYISAPISKSQINEDLDNITDIMDKLRSDGIDETKPDSEITKIIKNETKRFKELNIYKEPGNYRIHKDDFMKLRTKIRMFVQFSKDMEHLANKEIKSRKSEFENVRPENNYLIAVQELCTQMLNATTKMFASFKFSNITDFKAKTDASQQLPGGKGTTESADGYNEKDRDFLDMIHALSEVYNNTEEYLNE